MLTTPPRLSIVIPLHNEAGNIAPLMAEIVQHLRDDSHVGGAYEIILVDDGSTDATPAEARAEAQKHPHVRVLHLPQRQGMSPAIRAGVRAACGTWIMTADGDGQNDPADMPRLIHMALSLGDHHNILVCGLRLNRQDTAQKRMASRVANTLRQAVLRDGCPDTGCALKMFRRDLYLSLPFFHGLHRFMPALGRHYGATVLQTPVNDRARTRGVSKSDIAGRAVRGLVDMLGVAWLMARTPAPQQAQEAGQINKPTE
ncbi:MAG: glycosyltransferase family 2 protein [Alphaproteobacteria bacterium]|nr:glycosyltransferase family 2 protein [Alphaproteobacteria bacterium]NDC56078.1 glycosyltransferase family 2 protein [Alphaproteobacteria bacterium]NDG05104.1 glycosyltransferase family 2 protein [Alphaproteobacteria bacterium]